jgi:hypothetical protein
MAITISGDGSITGLAVGGLPDGTVDNDTIAAATIADAKMASGGGKVLQVVEADSTTSTGLSAAATWTAITDASITITPISTSSRIIIDFNTGGYAADAVLEIGLRIKRGATVVRELGRYSYVNNTATIITLPISFTCFDSPVTTAATTYTVELYKQVATGSIGLNTGANTKGLIIRATEIGV